LFAQEPPVDNNDILNISKLKEDTVKLEKHITGLSVELEKLKSMQLELNSSIEKNLIFQQNLQKSTTKLLEQTITEKNQLPSLKVNLLQPTNLYIFALPLVTIFIVVGSTILSLRTIKIKAQESLDALEASNRNQLEISKINNDNQLAISIRNNESERLRSQEAIISNSRQKWINTLRDDLALLTSNLTVFMSSTLEQRTVVFQSIWNEYYKVQLLLNPKEDLHNELIKELDAIIKLCSSGYNINEFMKLREAILDKSKEILKFEWDRVKTFD
jgi:hypothetical protein